eukprot:scaffold357350_cov70-Cyclotella_meneghiniana.AAC.1
MTLPSGMSGRGGLFVGLKAAVIAQNTYEATIHSSQTSTSPGCGLIKSRHSAMNSSTYAERQGRSSSSKLMETHHLLRLDLDYQEMMGGKLFLDAPTHKT